MKITRFLQICRIWFDQDWKDRSDVHVPEKVEKMKRGQTLIAVGMLFLLFVAACTSATTGEPESDSLEFTVYKSPT